MTHTKLFCLAGEDAAHHKLTTRITDRLLVEGIDWLEEGAVLDGTRTWAGLQSVEYFQLSKACARAREEKLNFYGGFQNDPKALEARQYRAAILLFMKVCKPPPTLLIIARDLDGEPNRRHGFESAVEHTKPPFPVVLAAPQPEAEAWYVAGYVPRDDTERKRLDEVTRKLGFDPTERPHQLKSTTHASVRDAKSVLEMLEPNRDRWIECLDEPWSVLERHGDGSVGMCEFVSHLRAALTVVFPEMRKG
ncbi:MAG: hypothetical protein H6718_21605 [Polyangiaceae bacterium]|nr:hypothetical protein [Myxococcales bacterium]MCB9588017.1 hypothetical protein [Polyangiaceae bacterium]